MQKVFICLCVLGAVSIPVRGQLNSGNLSQLTEKDGLSSNTVNAMLVDNQGYLWVSTYNGLARYNGYEFEKFYSNPNDSNAIQGMIAYSLMQDSHGNIWVGTNPGFIEVYDPVKRAFSAFDYNPLMDPLATALPLYGYNVTSICEDPNGNIYFGINCNETLSSALLYRDAKSGKIDIFEPPDSLQIQNVFQMRKDLNGNIWIISYSGVFKIDLSGNVSVENNRFLNLRLPANDYVADFIFADIENVWLSTGFGRLVRLNLSSGEFKIFDSPLLSSDPAYAASAVLTTDMQNQIWIGTQQGVAQFDTEKEEFKIFDTGTKNELGKESITCFASDSSGNLFMGTANSGILRYEKKPVFTSYVGNSSDRSTILPGWANILYETSDGKIWIHSDGGLSILNPKAGKVESRLDYSVSNLFLYVTAFWENSPVEHFFCSGRGILYKYLEASRTLEKISLPGLPDTLIITKHLQDSRGNEWLTSRNGLYRKSPDTDQFVRYDLNMVKDAGAGSNDITDLFEGSKHGLWIASNFGLFLYHYDTDQIERQGYDKNKGDVLISQDINSVYEDSQGNLWVGQWQGGLSKYIPETGEIKTYTLDDGLPSMGIQSVTSDDNGMIWLSTFNGLSRFDPKTEQFNNFSIDDGIQGSLFADGSYLKTSSGQIIFGGANGITIFDPDDFKVKYEPPKVFLTNLKLFNKTILPKANGILEKPISKTQSVTLKYNQNNLTIEYVGIHYSNPLKNRFSYLMENYDEQWREVGTQREAFYPALPSGSYTFKVKASNNQGVWSNIASLNITIKPPWYATVWAYILYGLLLIPVAFLIHKYMRNRAIRQERERAQKKELEQAREIEKAYNELKSTQAQLVQSEKMASLGELTAGIAHEIQNPLNFVNNFSEINAEIIEELKEELQNQNVNVAEELANDIASNESKINFHGKRAESIVKGMLLHSRGSSGQKEPTDINALCDEYLRLSYHGFRAKDQSFNADFKLEVDESLPKVKAVPQEIGRVLLNLINNAFYAVASQPPKVGQKDIQNDYKPTVIVKTSYVTPSGGMRGTVEIRVQDNGPGIPGNIKEKIFQPFFSTKPTGQGTGLGLSMSYDIITKGHNGTLNVKSEEGRGTEFIIKIPVIT